MFGVTFRNSCFKVKLLRRPSDLTRRLSYRGKQGCGDFSKTIPTLVYLHNPLTYLWTQFQLARLRLMWDQEFDQNEFYRGTKQSAIVMTDCIRDQNQTGISRFTTQIGFKQISYDMLLSQNDARLQLLRFRFEDMHRSIPMKVVFFKNGKNKSCFIDMLFVGMRNTNDFSNTEERQVIGKTLDKLEKERKIRPKVENIAHKIIFAEIYMRFFRNYTPTSPNDWSVSYYKIISFDILNYKGP